MLLGHLRHDRLSSRHLAFVAFVDPLDSHTVAFLLFPFSSRELGGAVESTLLYGQTSAMPIAALICLVHFGLNVCFQKVILVIVTLHCECCCLWHTHRFQKIALQRRIAGECSPG